jgi:hypothetical protein
LEDRIEMLRYSIEAMERQAESFAPGSREENYARKIVASCRTELERTQKDLAR